MDIPTNSHVGRNKGNAWRIFARTLIVLGGLAMLAGAVDPLEGSVLIFIGSGLVTLATFVNGQERAVLRDWIYIFTLITIGFTAMMLLSSIGGIGGRSGHSLWWGILILPYPVGWVLGMVSLGARAIRILRRRHAHA